MADAHAWTETLSYRCGNRCALSRRAECLQTEVHGSDGDYDRRNSLPGVRGLRLPGNLFDRRHWRSHDKLLERILQITPDITGTVFDTASTIERATQGLGSAAWSSRCSYVIGDCFTSVPQGAEAGKGRVLIVDMVVPDTDAMSFRKLLDLNLLAMTGGRERIKAVHQLDLTPLDLIEELTSISFRNVLRMRT